MFGSSPSDPVAGNGLKKAALPHTTDRSLPEGQGTMLADARASVTGKLSNLIGGRRAEVADRLYPDMGPIEAAECFNRNLRGSGGRKVGCHEIDAILDVLGRESEEDWFRFCLRRRGIIPPAVFEREGEVERLSAEVERQRQELAAKDAVIAEQARAFAAESNAKEKR